MKGLDEGNEGGVASHGQRHCCPRAGAAETAMPVSAVASIASTGSAPQSCRASGSRRRGALYLPVLVAKEDEVVVAVPAPPAVAWLDPVAVAV